MNKKYCKYDLTKEYGIGYTTNKNTPFYFDLEDYNKIKDYAWRLSPNGYIVAYSSQLKTIVYLHHIILPINNGLDRDHKDRNKANNRKSNLRLSVHRNNIRNSSVKSSNKSGVIGVFWRENRNKWSAYIDFDYKRKYLGLYTDKNEAIKARLQAELNIFGKEFAPQRHLFKEYGIE